MDGETMIRKCMLCAMLSLVFALRVEAQDEPLGSSVVSNFVHVSANFGSIRYTFVPSETNHFASIPLVGASVNFDTMGETLTFAWRFRDKFPAFGGTGASGNEEITEDVGFRPTAVAKKTNSDAALFVAGFDGETRTVTVQEWTFEVDVEVNEDPLTKKPKASLAKILVRKTMLVSSPDIKPIETMMFNQCSGELWLFEDGAPHVLRAVNVNMGASSLRRVADATTEGYAFLARTKYVHPLFVKATAPDGGGFIAVCKNHRVWEFGQHIRGLEMYSVTTLRDSDCDGAFDEILTGTYQELFLDKQYIQHQDVFR